MNVAFNQACLDNTTHNIPSQLWGFNCGKCGFKLRNIVVAEGDDPKIYFCPHCGRKVIYK